MMRKHFIWSFLIIKSIYPASFLTRSPGEVFNLHQKVPMILICLLELLTRMVTLEMQINISGEIIATIKQEVFLRVEKTYI